jgi:transposase
MDKDDADEERPIIDVDIEELKAALERIKTGRGTPEDYELIERLIDSYVDLTQLLRQRGTTIARLRRLFGLTGSEKTKDVLGRGGSKGDGGESRAGCGGCGGEGRAADPSEPEAEAETGPLALADAPSSPASEASEAGSAPETAASETSDKKKPKGHGRLGWTDYAGAPCIVVLHESLREGQRCPLCGRGKLYDLKRPAPIVRIIGQPPLSAKCWLCQTLRCTACGHLFTARAPEEAQGAKYDETAVSMIILMRYGMGLPHYRLAKAQDNLGTPVPPSWRSRGRSGRSRCCSTAASTPARTWPRF